MNPLQRILVVDGPDRSSDEALVRAAALAKGPGAEITVLAPIGHVPRLFPGADLDVEELVVEAHRTHLAATAARLRALGANVRTKLRVGVPVVEIVREVLESRAELLVKVQDPSSARRSRFGSADNQLLRKCPCPVWIVRPGEHLPYTRVVAAVDPFDDRPGRDARLDHKILDWALRIARQDGAELVIAHAWELVGESLLAGARGGLSPAALTALRDEVRREHAAKLESLVRSMDPLGLDPRVQLVMGRADAVIPALVERERAELLVMGTVARSGIAGFVIGNTAEQILAELGAAVLAVKPAGFVSPITRD